MHESLRKNHREFFRTIYEGKSEAAVSRILRQAHHKELCVLARLVHYKTTPENKRVPYKIHSHYLAQRLANLKKEYPFLKQKLKRYFGSEAKVRQLYCEPKRLFDALNALRSKGLLQTIVADDSGVFDLPHENSFAHPQKSEKGEEEKEELHENFREKK